MIGNPEIWESDAGIFGRAWFKADKRGLKAAQEFENVMASKGWAVVHVAVSDSGTDVGRSVVKSAIGLGALAATGFGFVGTSRKQGQIVLTLQKVSGFPGS